jgi:hypothetical protein
MLTKKLKLPVQVGEGAVKDLLPNRSGRSECALRHAKVDGVRVLQTLEELSLQRGSVTLEGNSEA